MTGSKKILLSICIAALALVAGCGILPVEEEQIAPPLTEPKRQEYRTAVAERTRIVYAVRGIGVLEATDVYKLSFPDQRKIKTKDVANGDEVQKGDILITGETGDLADQIIRQEYAVQNQQIVVDNAQLGLRRTQIAFNNFLREISSNEKRDPGYEENKELIEMDIVQAQNGLRQAQLSLEQAQWELSNLRDQYQDAKLTAPVSGKVIFVENINAGELTTPDAPLVSIAVPGHLQVAFVTSDLDMLAQVRTGMPAELTYDDETYSGEVSMSSDTVPSDASDLLRRTIIIDADSLPQQASMGDQVNVYIPIKTSDDTIVIPRDALRTFLGQTKVNVLDSNNPDGAPEERSVEVGIETNTEVEISAGLEEGEIVILQ